jgi:hypothetical protein
MRQCVRPNATRHLHLSPRDERSGHGRAKEVFAIVDRTRAQRWKNEIVHELSAQVLDVTLLRARREGLLTDSVEFRRALSDVGRDADHPGVVVLTQPRNNDRRVESA